MKSSPFRRLMLAASAVVMMTGMSFAGEGAKLVPEAVRKAGKITVGSQQTFPPIEFRAPGASVVTGASVDLLTEVAKRLDLKLDYVQAEYAALIPGVEAKRFDVASGGISDTEEREQKLDFVNYMMSGASILVRAEDAGKFKTIHDFCGKAVATLLGSRVIMAKVEEASAACKAKGAPEIRAEQLPSAPDARMQLDLKRVDGYLGDFPALAYMSAQFPGKYSIVGGNYMLTNYVTSWGFAKDNAPLRDAVKVTLAEMLKDGAYQSIMDKWGVGGGVLPEITVNLPASKRQ